MKKNLIVIGVIVFVFFVSAQNVMAEENIHLILANTIRGTRYRVMAGPPSRPALPPLPRRSPWRAPDSAGHGPP